MNSTVITPDAPETDFKFHPGEEVWNTLLHLIGLVLVLCALPVLITLAAEHGTVMEVVTDALQRDYGDVQAQTGGFRHAVCIRHRIEQPHRQPSAAAACGRPCTVRWAATTRSA